MTTLQFLQLSVAYVMGDAVIKGLVITNGVIFTTTITESYAKEHSSMYYFTERVLDYAFFHLLFQPA